MSGNDHETPSTEFPNFDLAWAFDDVVKPDSVTIFSEEGAEIRTHWITIEKDCAWDLNNIS
jgi:hypothetical protein